MYRLPPMSAPVEGEKYRVVSFKYYNAEPRKLTVVPKHYILRDGIIMVSRADANGLITHANHPFIITSGYSQTELIGNPHSILRHPDMPRAVFAELWQTVLAGQEWRGLIKNLRKDGGYYWTQTSIQPLFQNGQPHSFTSVRRKVDRDTIKRTEALYAEMRQNEQ